jgi:hypothetical protein
MNIRTGRRWLPLATVGIGLVALVAAAGAASAAGQPVAPVRGEVPGLTGEAANRLAGEAATRFKELTERRVAAARSGLAAETLHTAWGTAFSQPQAQGIRGTHSVLTGSGTTTRGGEYIYSPTAMSPGGACMEITTAYTPSGPLVWAWDWCGGNAGVGKAVAINSSFLSKYTTTVNGLPAYTFEVSKTDAATNAWAAYLFNYQTNAFETFYTSSGTYDLGETWFGWDMFEIYSDVEPSTGVGYYCTDMAGQSFDASAIQVKLNGTWAAATPANSYSYGNPPPPGSNFQCPKLTFAMDSPNNHWTARIAR